MKAYCGQLAVTSGMGRGEVQACMASLRSLVIATVPWLVYGRLYGLMTRRGGQWAWGALGGALPELLHRTLRDSDLPNSARE